jgi:hypothetical protein
MRKVSIYCGGNDEMPPFIVAPSSAKTARKTDHFIACKNFRASPNRA